MSLEAFSGRAPSDIAGERRGVAPWALRLAFLFAVASVAVLLTAYHYSATGVWWLATAERMATFEAAAPFQYRVLTPVIVALLHSATSVGIDPLFVLLEVVFWMLLVVVAERALHVFGICRNELTRSLLAMTVLVPVAVHLILPDLRILTLFADGGASWQRGEWHFTDLFRYVYDLPAAVLTLGLVVLLRRFVTTLDGRSLAGYLGLFALSALNRETTVFLLPVFLVVCYRVLDHRTLVAALLAQVLILFGVQTALHGLFADNTNPHANVLDTEYENHLDFNLGLLGEPAYLVVFLLRFAGGLYIPALLLYRHLDPFLGRTLLAFAVPFLIFALVFGRVQEHRVTVELVPLLWLGAVQVIAAYRARQADREVSPDADRPAFEAVNGGRGTRPAR